MNTTEMDVTIERARCLHRVVRALHDGHCPRCSAVFPAANAEVPGGEKCPVCKFTISEKEAAEAVLEFAPIMQKSLAVFEEWRSRRTA